MKKNARKQKKGFGLLEVLISTVIVIMMMSALVMIGKKSLSNTVYVQQRAQAIYLSQEGLEIIKQMRDTNWVDGKSNTKWDSLAMDKFSHEIINLTEVSNPESYNTLAWVDSPENRYYLENNAYGWPIDVPMIYYTNNQQEGTRFERTVKVENANPANNKLMNILPGLNDQQKETSVLKITVTTSWDNGKYSVSVSDIMTNWRPNY